MENANFKSGFVTLIGRPNVGKSTLMNHLIGQKIAITSSKPQTTRNRIQTVYTSDQGQIVFLDTPGINRARNKLGEYMVQAAESTLKEVDVVLWLVEPSDYIGKGERYIAQKLQNVHVPVILIMNKTDTVDKSRIPGFMDRYREILDFADMIPVCALRGQHMEEVIQAIFRFLPCGPKFYDDDTVTDQPQRQIVAELIREKALRCMDEEVPHGIAVSIESMQEREAGRRREEKNRTEKKKERHPHEKKQAAEEQQEDRPLSRRMQTEARLRETSDRIMDIEATIICEKESHKGMVIGKNGNMLRKIGSQARYEIEQMLEMPVNLQLWVKVKKDWRDSDYMIKNFGYDARELRE